MVFSSILFLLYFLPIALIGYHLTPVKWKNLFLLVISICFYSWGAPRFIFVILGTTFLDFHFVKWMDASIDKYRRRLLLILSLSLNLGLLFYFKYSNFFVENLNVLLASCGIQTVSIVKIILPIGISFYTFESLTYVIDVYRKEHKPLNHFWNYQLYIILFPKLIAGPIIRYCEISEQLENREQFNTIDYKLTGLVRFVIGLSKKVLIANVLAAGIDPIFSQDIKSLSFLEAWTAILGYTFQIYFDFSGYSDMAIGLGKIFGFKFPENFDNPYTAKSITEFWRKWHITLGTWMKNYLYIPLGGNRNKYRTYINLWVVFLASGFWHGASWAFIFWGAYHGFFLVLERLFLLRFYNKIGTFFSVLISFVIVAIGWVFFRIEHIADGFIFVNKLFNPTAIYSITNIVNEHFIFVFILATVFSFITLSVNGKQWQHFFYCDTVSMKKSVFLILLSAVLMLLCIASIAGFGFNPFIYFRF